jgi:hypothetical protein
MSQGVNQFNIGRDYTLTINSLTGPLNFNIFVQFDVKPQYADVKVAGIDGITRSRHLPNGHTGSLMYDRADSNVTDYFAAQEANFFAGFPPDQIVITETVTEANGSLTQYQYTQVDLWLEDAGTIQGLNKIEQKMSFYAARKVKIS